MTSIPTESAVRSGTVPGTVPGTDGDGVHHFEADLTFGGCRDPRCPTGSVEPTVDMS
ncbi:hypothetical protein ENKNEFLB_02890 [Nocardioides aquaticus]|uniref:Uncharacterized protein n=1 Tax=Nocardioides aquaticus TaxID=160826 RepID=A0ABX8ELK1_9ACTN|nr:hypothetical protein [Nocardioides aquaticus]QVT80491.1 hypothetical protein ENKNEFLB_02890 [Nocardioides aquaticus]